jgi:hypothetical protein
VQAPSAPTDILGFLIGGHLTLTWAPGADNSGTYDYVRVLANDVGVGDFGADRTSGDVGPWTTGDSRTFTLNETDIAGNTSPTAPALKRVPALVGKTLDAAQSALEAAGIRLGQVTQGGVGKPGTVTGPTNLVLAAPGAAVDVTVAPGSTDLSVSKLVFRVVSAKKLRATRRMLPARVLVTRRARLSAVLYSPQQLKLSTWRFVVKAGRTIVKLRFPSQVRRPGSYSIRWTAASGRDVVTRTIRVRLFKGKRRGGPIEVVIAGSAVSPKLTLGVKTSRIVKTTGMDSTFDAAGAGSNGLQVMVVDVDQFGLGFVRDLHTVFPSLRMVVLSRDPKVLARASKVGATVALPRSIPNSVLAAVVSRLLMKG